MKIGYDAKRAFLNFSGLGNYSRNIISLVSRYYPSDEIRLYTPRTGRIIPDFPPEASIVHQPRSFWARRFPSLWRTAGLTADLKKDKTDIFHGLSNELPLNIEKSGIRSVVTIHDLIFIRYPELYNRIDRNIYVKKLKYAVKAADRIIAASEQTKKDIIEFTGADNKKISVVYQSCDPSFLTRPDDSVLNAVRTKYNLPEQFMLYVGTIEKRKNLLSVLMAMHEMNIGKPLVVIGKETAYASEVYEFIRKNRIENIHFLKGIPSGELPAIFRLAVLFVYPSSFEGFGIPVLEALNSEVPVIAGMGSCLEETGGPLSIYIDPADTRKLGKEILRVLNDESLRMRMINAGLKHAENFTGELTTRKLHELYESLL
jgi:glycosyltransferase involved in cell wall biosynthesis